MSEQYGFADGGVDGSWGGGTTRALQKTLNAINSGAKPRAPATAGQIAVDGSFGAQTCIALQAFLASTPTKCESPIDGGFGGATKKSLQRFLQAQGYCARASVELRSRLRHARLAR